MARLIIEEPCEFETGVFHDRPGTDGKPCGYLAHVYCNKCGWAQGSHECTKRITVDPADLPSYVIEAAAKVLVDLLGLDPDDPHMVEACMDEAEAAFKAGLAQLVIEEEQ